ncbi:MULTISPECIES: hypothetical protein [unclassified Streptomyces]|uniref:hypothetical protein n=1 Tax=unclassified Streptomyces TaxID=2593676 RepID=UPI0025534EA7|nr:MULTISPECIES: hypothetical protein [unclassified Streptomyces]WRZ66823.1 hypothetical protein OG408_24425 [Streptomyces sp. NBC_01257]
MKRVSGGASEPPPAWHRVGPDPESRARFLAALDLAIERRVSECAAEAAGLEALAAAVEAVAAALKGVDGPRGRAT